MNLLLEYSKRHSLCCVPPTNAGVCFFEGNGLQFVVLTSTATRSVNACSNCNRNDGTIIFELFFPTSQGCVLYAHVHIDPNEDLLKVIERVRGIKSKPVTCSYKNTEVWLWQLFINNNRLSQNANWVRLLSELPKQEPLRTHEQMAWVSSNCPKIFNHFYNMYQTLMVGRKYLLLE